MNSLEMAKEIENEIIENRRALHRIPELELKLPETVKYISEKLDEYGVSYRRLVEGNAIVAEIGMENDGKCIALRADMDALPIKEETGLSFSSVHEGAMHACGHDGHAAMALGACRILKNLEKTLGGKVKVFFQPGEEMPGGAKPMIDEGCMENPHVDAVIGLHEGAIAGDFKKGAIGVKSGALMASADKFTIRVRGKGCHGARPHEGVDPILIVSEINMALQKIVSREISPTVPAVISVCMINGGSTHNIIPEEVTECGTVRALSEEARGFIEKRIGEISRGIAVSYGAEAELNYERLYPVLINDEKFTDFFEETASELLGAEDVFRMKEPTMGAEDMAFFLREAPGTFFMLNNLKADKNGIKHPHHSSKFDIEESELYKGTALFVETVIRYLKRT